MGDKKGKKDKAKAQRQTGAKDAAAAMMTIMRLLRLPTQEELGENIPIEHFVEAFHKMAVAGFEAEVEDLGDAVDLDSIVINKAEWFVVEKR